MNYENSNTSTYKREMSRIANKGLVVPLIFFCSLIQTLTLTPPTKQCIVGKPGHV